MRDTRVDPDLPSDLQIAQEIALKAATDIVAQAEFASLDASNAESLGEASKRFDAILHYAERALTALERVKRAHGPRNSVQ